jgi:rhomboid protease GluP
MHTLVSEASPADSVVDGRPRSWLDRAPVTRMLLVLNVAVFAVQLLESARRGAPGSFTLSQLLEFGASYPPATIGEARWETLVTACFLHGGLVHVAFNMIALWQAGPLVERAVGSARMAPMYLVAGACGNLLSVGYAFARHAVASSVAVGASGAISGVIAAALVVGWRLQGWRGPLTQAMARWLGFVVLFGLFSNLSGGNIDNAAHIGGAITGAAIASMWRRGYRYTAAATRAILAVCVGVLVTCVSLVGWHDRTDRFAAMTLDARSDFTQTALMEGRCRDAHDGLAAVERLRDWAAPVSSLRTQVETVCGHTGPAGAR